ncbi:hypothetical protein Tco_0916352 [Tanacetum coccineum]
MSLASTVTYTSDYTDSEPGRVFWGADEELSDRGSPRVIVYGYDGLPMQPVAPPSPDYVPGPEHPPSPDYVPGPEHPPLLAEEDQPLPTDASPIALSPDYVADSDSEEDPEEDHADYPADGGDGDDEPSDDDDDDTDDEDEEPFEDEDDDEEEHLAPADSVIAPTIDYVPSFEESESFKTDESATTPPSPPTHRTTARISIRPEAPIPLPSEAEIERFLALPIPPPSPLSSWSSPLPQIPSPPLPPPPSSLHLPPHVPISLPLPSSPLPPLPALPFIPPPVDRREDITEAELPPRKRLCPIAPTSRCKVWESLTVAPRPTGGGPSFPRGLGPSMGFSSAIHYELQGYRTHAWMQDHRIDAQDSLIAALTAQVSSLQGHLATALGEIRALQARDQARADAPEGTASTAVGLVFSFLVSDNHNNMPPRRSSATARAAAAAPMTAAAVEQLIEARVSAALANHETLRNSTNGHGDGSHNSGIGNRGTTRTPRECTYKDFLNCHPLNFKGTEGVVVLAQWFEKMESVFHISNCAVENQVKFATCTFVGNALTWWNSHMKAVTQDVAYAMD